MVDFPGKYAQIWLRRRQRGARAILFGGFKQQEDLKTYSHLPDYDDFQGRDLGVESFLSKIAQKIYADFRKPSWRTLKHHLFAVEIPKKFLRDIKNIDGGGKKGDFKQEMMFGGAARTPISNTFNELVEMDFVDYGGYAAFLQIQDAFVAISCIGFLWAQGKGRPNCINGPRVGYFELVSGVFGAPGIIVVDKDSRSTGGIFGISAHLVISRYEP